ASSVMRRRRKHLVKDCTRKVFMQNLSSFQRSLGVQAECVICQQQHIQRKCLMRHWKFMKKSVKKGKSFNIYVAIYDGGIRMKKILITGALGQMCSELLPKLRQLDCTSNVICTDI